MIWLNGVEVVPTIFPDKTSQVWNLPHKLTSDLNTVEWKFEHEGEFVQLTQLKCLLDTVHDGETSLELSYLPYGRQDKDISNDASFALVPFALLLNKLKFKEVVISDPHSARALNLINNSTAKYPIEQVLKAKLETKSDLVCYPDAGAVSKYSHVFRNEKFDFVEGSKTRIQKTGKIVSYKLLGDVNEKRVLIVDDICDGGATFVMLTHALIIAGAREINLFVSHGIFSKGINVLFDAGIKRIFTIKGERHYDTTNFI